MIVNGFKSKAQAIRHLRDAGYLVSGLLARAESNPKVAKNGKVGVYTAPLHLAPFDLSGFQVCPQASAGCAAACLHTAGNPAYMEQKQYSRVLKTQAYFRQRDAFMAVLVFEIAAHARKAESLGMECGVRLNATSDLPWEVRKVEIDGQTVGLMEAFPNVQFYDYTKVTKRMLAFCAGKMPANYHLTFSRTEGNSEDCERVLIEGGNVTVVFTLDLYKQAVESGRYAVWNVADGDAHDFTPAHGSGVIVALKAKGDARNDFSGFVVR